MDDDDENSYLTGMPNLHTANVISFRQLGKLGVGLSQSMS